MNKLRIAMERADWQEPTDLERMDALELRTPHALLGEVTRLRRVNALLQTLTGCCIAALAVLVVVSALQIKRTIATLEHADCITVVHELGFVPRVCRR
jgi:hypothetical protein